MRVYSHPACSLHDPGEGHAERPARLTAVTEALRQALPALDWHEAPRASRGQQLRHVLLPAALPSIATGVLQALAFAWVTAIGSELFLSSGAGLGNLMMNAEAGSRMEVVVIGVLCIGLLGYAMNQLFSRLSQHLLRWRDTR